MSTQSLNPRLFTELVFLLIIFVSLGHDAVLSGEEVSILTYNIHHGRGTDNKVDFQRIADVIIDSNADIACLQEVDRNTARIDDIDSLHMISNLTGMTFIFGKNLSFQGGAYGNAILSRKPILEYSNLPLEKLGEGEQRGMLRAKISLDGDSYIQVCNTHLDHRSDPRERLHSIMQIKESFGRLKASTPVLLVGDFNTSPKRKGYEEMKRNWIDAWLKVHPLKKGYTIPSSNPSRRIDGQFIVAGADRLIPVEARVIKSNGSDHLPLLIKYKVVRP